MSRLEFGLDHHQIVECFGLDAKICSIMQLPPSLWISKQPNYYSTLMALRRYCSGLYVLGGEAGGQILDRDICLICSILKQVNALGPLSTAFGFIWSWFNISGHLFSYEVHTCLGSLSKPMHWSHGQRSISAPGWKGARVQGPTLPSYNKTTKWPRTR